MPHLLIRIGNTRGNFLLHPEVGTERVTLLTCRSLSAQLGWLTVSHALQIRVSYFQRLVTTEGEVTFKVGTAIAAFIAHLIWRNLHAARLEQDNEA